MSVLRVARQELRPFFTPKALVEYLSVSERTVREMLSKHRIPSYNLPGASAILPVLSATAEDAIDDRSATANPFNGVRMRAGDPLVSKPARRSAAVVGATVIGGWLLVRGVITLL